jgi:hypothetical protein
LHLPNCPDYPDGYFDNENTNNIGTWWEREDNNAALRHLTERDGLLVLDEVGLSDESVDDY